MEKFENMEIDELEKEMLKSIEGMSDYEIDLASYGGDEDYMNLDKELMEYICKGRDAFEDMRDAIENSRIYTNPETRHKIEKELKLTEQICELIEKFWETE